MHILIGVRHHGLNMCRYIDSKQRMEVVYGEGTRNLTDVGDQSVREFYLVNPETEILQPLAGFSALSLRFPCIACV